MMILSSIKVSKLEVLQDQMKSIKAKADMISSDIKETTKSAWANLYADGRRNPGSVVMESTSGLDVAQLLFVPSDKYLSVTEERADELRETYGDDVIQEDTTFSFDSAMIEKYGEVLSNLIIASDDIAESDKEK